MPLFKVQFTGGEPLMVNAADENAAKAHATATTLKKVEGEEKPLAVRGHVTSATEITDKLAHYKANQ